jgi:hypothetical protein
LNGANEERAIDAAARGRREVGQRRGGDLRSRKITNRRFTLANSVSRRRVLQYKAGMLEHADFSVVVKNRARPPKPWRWEIYRAGRTSPVDHSEVYFESMSEASRAGKAALKLMLGDNQN